ncbi:hypothetical protein, partial [Limnothrix sp. PR1529]|uniref:hypothetical protein n=1 Tax=Limnothrix sp. PR1529 TaxID=1704291 RepID=UPI001F185ADF
MRSSIGYPQEQSTDSEPGPCTHRSRQPSILNPQPFIIAGAIAATRSVGLHCWGDRAAVIDGSVLEQIDRRDRPLI